MKTTNAKVPTPSEFIQSMAKSTRKLVGQIAARADTIGENVLVLEFLVADGSLKAEDIRKIVAAGRNPASVTDAELVNLVVAKFIKTA